MIGDKFNLLFALCRLRQISQNNYYHSYYFNYCIFSLFRCLEIFQNVLKLQKCTILLPITFYNK